jgi:parallel beta-helix repeat protein
MLLKRRRSPFAATFFSFFKMGGKMKHRCAITIMGFSLLACLGCKEETTQVTQIVGPQDWRPPQVRWLAPPEAEIRGTVALDVSIIDSSTVPFALLYIDGIKRDSLTSTPWRFQVVTDSLTDGLHLLEVRAQDEFANEGVSPILRVDVMNGTPEGPRLIWVPDNFERIQDAINAATDLDTIRVRDGTYYETLNLFGKGIWIESEHGPLHCAIDDAGANNAFYVIGNSVLATIRGFWMTGSGFLIYLWYGGQANMRNNIMQSDTADGLLIALNSGGTVANNLFSGTGFPVQLAYFWGDFFNNILQNAGEYAFWNSSTYGNPVVYGYNLFWNNTHDYGLFAPAITDVYGDPRLDLEQGRLLEGSPAVDAGDSTVFDRNGTRSDIGPFGGPLSY